MAKRKLARFAEMQKFSHVVQPSFEEVFKKDYCLKGKWNQEFFGNENPIVLELGCGKGEYTIGLASKYLDKNFIGIDIKGARMWIGASEALKNNLSNVAFIRTRIELINSFFDVEEINEIWLTFPDPQLKKTRKRLTSSRFLNSYKFFLNKRGSINLKTDNRELYDYTLDMIKKNNLELEYSTDNLYEGDLIHKILLIKTFYEKQFIEEGLSIKYLKFKLNNSKIIEEPENK